MDSDSLRNVLSILGASCLHVMWFLPTPASKLHQLKGFLVHRLHFISDTAEGDFSALALHFISCTYTQHAAQPLSSYLRASVFSWLLTSHRAWASTVYLLYGPSTILRPVGGLSWKLLKSSLADCCSRLRALSPSRSVIGALRRSAFHLTRM